MFGFEQWHIKGEMVPERMKEDSKKDQVDVPRMKVIVLTLKHQTQCGDSSTGQPLWCLGVCGLNSCSGTPLSSTKPPKA
jgi:hypothetical protein